MSLLLKKMNELKSSSESIISEIDDFNNYIYSLKEDSEAAYNLVYDFFNKIVEAEKAIDEINIKSVSEKYEIPFNHLYELLNSVYNRLIVQEPNSFVLFRIVHPISKILHPKEKHFEIRRMYSLLLVFL